MNGNTVNRLPVCARQRGKLKAINEQIHYLGQYLSTRGVYSQFTKSEYKAAFRSAHKADIDAHEEARKHLLDLYPDSSFPNMKELKAEKTDLQHILSRQNNACKSGFKEQSALRIAKANVDFLLGDLPDMTLEADYHLR